MWIHPHLLLHLYGFTLSANIKLLCRTNISSSGDFICQRSLIVMELCHSCSSLAILESQCESHQPLVRHHSESAVGLKTGKGEHHCTWKYTLIYSQAENLMGFISWDYLLLYSLIKNKVRGLPLAFSSKKSIKLIWRTVIVAVSFLVLKSLRALRDFIWDALDISCIF